MADEKLRLLLFEECDRDCPGCCNRDWDLRSFPVCRDFIGAQPAAGPCRPPTNMTTNGASARGAGSLSNTRRQNRSNGGSKTAKSAAAP